MRRLIFPTLFLTTLTSFASPGNFPQLGRSLDETFLQKRESFERLWDVSMNYAQVDELQGDLAKEHWTDTTTQSKTVREVTALVVQEEVTGEIKLINMNLGEEAAGVTVFNGRAGHRIIGRFHTHPYKYEMLKNNPFSPRDFVDLYQSGRGIQLVDGFFSLIKSGEKYFVMLIENADLAQTFFEQQTESAKQNGKTLFDFLYAKYRSSNTGNDIHEIRINAFLRLVGNVQDSGIGVYETTDGTWKALN